MQLKFTFVLFQLQKQLQNKTRMVQLPATAAIEYVAACWVSRAGGDFCPGVLLSGGLLPGGTFVRGTMPVPPKFNAYTHRLGFLCLS